MPFVAGATLAVVGETPWAVQALRFYAACILAFMGGVHWGLAIAGFGDDAVPKTFWLRLAGSVVPALVACVGLLLPPDAGLLLTAAAFAILLVGDLLAVRLGMAPGWYPRLRGPLTAVVVVCLLTASLA